MNGYGVPRAARVEFQVTTDFVVGRPPTAVDFSGDRVNDELS